MTGRAPHFQFFPSCSIAEAIAVLRAHASELSILSQLQPGRAGEALLREPAPGLSILSQLQQGKHEVFGYAIVENPEFSFNSFPVAASPGAPPPRLEIPAPERPTFNSFPVAAKEIENRLLELKARPFNSFPVAALKTALSTNPLCVPRLSILSQLQLIDYEVIREVVREAFNSFPVAARGRGCQHLCARLLGESRLSILSQLQLRQSLLRLRRGALSILSQLQLQRRGVVGHGGEIHVLQLSILSQLQRRARLAYQRLYAATAAGILSILSQLQRSIEIRGNEDIRRVTFNSFPVAATHESDAMKILLSDSFQFFPSCSPAQGTRSPTAVRTG